jgi:hypothetical protein
MTTKTNAAGGERSGVVIGGLVLFYLARLRRVLARALRPARRMRLAGSGTVVGLSGPV